MFFYSPWTSGDCLFSLRLGGLGEKSVFDNLFPSVRVYSCHRTTPVPSTTRPMIQLSIPLLLS